MGYRRIHRISLVCICAAALLLASCTSASLEQKIRQSESLRNLGEAYLIENKPTLALVELIKAEQLYDKDPLIQNDLGLAYMAKDEFALAEIHFKKALALKPDWSNALNNLATAYLKQKKWDIAIGHLRRLSKELLYTTPHYAFLNLGWAYYNKADYGQAEKYYKMALGHYEDGFSKDGTYLKTLVGLGRTAMKTGKTRLAVSYLEKAVAFAPDIADVWLIQARAYALAGDTAKARKAYRKVMDLQPASRLAEDARKGMAQLR